MTSNEHVLPDDLVPAEALASTSPIAISSLARLKPGKSDDEMQKAFTAMMSAAREEEGCEQYAIHATLGQPGVYAFYERWSSGADLLRHMQNPSLRTYHGQFFKNLDVEIEWLRPLDA
ncbi:putative quinol monooxygenase [Micromonospora profundi]|uniref:putative quinol monooxygenase n=1 Tax=Micromonospora profundi TaxID=1420889 RepID=UPI0036CB9C43